jgi:hypothetical protein
VNVIKGNGEPGLSVVSVLIDDMKKVTEIISGEIATTAEDKRKNRALLDTKVNDRLRALELRVNDTVTNSEESVNFFNATVDRDSRWTMLVQLYTFTAGSPSPCSLTSSLVSLPWTTTWMAC